MDVSYQMINVIKNHYPLRCSEMEFIYQIIMSLYVALPNRANITRVYIYMG